MVGNTIWDFASGSEATHTGCAPLFACFLVTCTFALIFHFFPLLPPLREPTTCLPCVPHGPTTPKLTSSVGPSWSITIGLPLTVDSPPLPGQPSQHLALATLDHAYGELQLITLTLIILSPGLLLRVSLSYLAVLCKVAPPSASNQMLVMYLLRWWEVRWWAWSGWPHWPCHSCD